MDNYGEWITLQNEVKNCKGCSLRDSDRLLDYGDRNARIMIVGDKPTDSDIEQGRVFTGTVGDYIENTLNLFDIDPKNVYFTNLVNCLPYGNRIKQDNVDSCIKCLRKQFRLVNPEIVLCLGTLACRRLIAPDFSLNTDHGKTIIKGRVMFMGTYHPNSFRHDEQRRDIFLSDIAALHEFCKIYPPYSK